LNYHKAFLPYGEPKIIYLYDHPSQLITNKFSVPSRTIKKTYIGFNLEQLEKENKNYCFLERFHIETPKLKIKHASAITIRKRHIRLEF